MRLHFDATLVRRLLEHSAAAPARAPTMEQMFKGRFRRDGQDLAADALPLDAWPSEADVDSANNPAKVPAGLWLVGDEGVYIMSNGRPALLVDTGPRHLTAPAAECDPERDPHGWWTTKCATFGGDDGVVFLGRAFGEALLKRERHGRVCLDLTPDAVLIVTPRPARA